MIAICPENYHATCSSLQLLVMNDVGLSINNLMFDSGAMRSDHSSITDEGETSMTIEKLVSVIIENGSKIDGIFQLEGFLINGQQLTSWLEDLKLVNLPELMYIWMGAKHSISLQHLHKLHISNCPKLKTIFSVAILRVLPLLKILVVEQCEELEQIIEDDKGNENVLNPQSPKVCFSQLKFLLVTHCNNLKHLFYISTSHEFPELEYLILSQDSRLVQVFKGDPRVRKRRVDVLLPKLKHVMLMQLPNLKNVCQGTEFHTVTNLLVHNCPKFSPTSTTTVEDMLQTSDLDKEIGFYLRPHLHDISCIITNGHEFLASKKEIKGIQYMQSQEQKLLPIPLQNLTEELIDGQSIDEPYLMNQQKPLEESCLKETGELSIQGGSKSEITATTTFFGDSERRNSSSGPLLIPFKKGVKRVIEERTTSKNAMIVDSSIHSECTSSQSGPLVTSQHKSHPHSEISISQTKINTDKENEGLPINIGDSVANGLISLFQPVEDDGEGRITTPCVSEVAAEHHSTKDNIVAKALSDLEESLKMPLKDIASSEADSLRLLTALNFLSHLSLKDEALSDGLKALINSMHKEFPSILCSFKQAFATTDKFAVIEAHQNDATITLVSEISKAKSFLDEAQQKEEILKEQIIQLKRDIKDREAELSSLQEEKDKCIEETIGYIKELENVRKDKSQMVEDQIKARHEIFKVDYQWSVLCSQFQHNRIVVRNSS